MGIPLQIAEPTGRYRRILRRYTYSRYSQCPSSNIGHEASVYIDEVSERFAEKVSGDNWPHDDDRWPLGCRACGYMFADDDPWQRNDNAIYRLPDDTEFTFWGSFGRCAPPGTMIRASWYDEYAAVKDRESWLVSLPDGGEWLSTQKASGGGHWEVTGTPPNITVTPSIWHNPPDGWHGFIRNGELVPA